MTSCVLPVMMYHSKIGSTLKGKNLTIVRGKYPVISQLLSTGRCE